MRTIPGVIGSHALGSTARLYALAPLWQVLLVALVCGLGALGALEHARACGVWQVGRPIQRPSQAMAKGLAAFQRGDFEGAAASWQAAARLYAETKQPQAHSLALTHLARAYAALGH